jgi:glucose-6-phosphate isomerase
MSEELGKPIRVLSVWCRKLEALGQWYETLLANSLSKQGRGPTPLTLVQTRDLHARTQQLLEGPRDKLITHLFVKGPRTVPIAIGMADHNEDGLNALARKSLGDVANTAYEWLHAALWKMARPASSLILPSLTEHTLGQVMQLLMLATVIEGRLMGINPYGEPGVETYRRGLREQLKA